MISNATAEGGTTTPAGYAGTWTITCVCHWKRRQSRRVQRICLPVHRHQRQDWRQIPAMTLLPPPLLPRQSMGMWIPAPSWISGVMNGNIPAPLVAFDEDDEFFLTLTNVGMIMRPDLFEQHTVHFHGYPNASSFYDGVPDASVAINIGASFTYYYLAPDAGTYFWHCHITPPEHLQMGMVGQLYVRPRQDRVPAGGSLYTYLGYQNGIAEPATNPVRGPAHGLQSRVPTSCAAPPCRPLTPAPPGRRPVPSAMARVPRDEGTTLNMSTTTATARPAYDVDLPHPDARLRSQLPLRRHDLQPGNVCGHEGQVLPAERAELPRHGRGRSASHSHE